MIERQIRQFGDATGRGAQEQAHAFRDVDGFFFQHAQTYFGARKILHDSEGNGEFSFDFPNAADNIHKHGGIPVGKIEPEDTHSGLGQSLERGFAVGGRPHSGDDFGFHGSALTRLQVIDERAGTASGDASRAFPQCISMFEGARLCGRRGPAEPVIFCK